MKTLLFCIDLIYVCINVILDGFLLQLKLHKRQLNFIEKIFYFETYYRCNTYNAQRD